MIDLEKAESTIFAMEYRLLARMIYFQLGFLQGAKEDNFKVDAFELFEKSLNAVKRELTNNKNN